MSDENKPSGMTIAKNNLKKGLNSPGAKLMLAGIFAFAVVASVIAAIVFRDKPTAGSAKLVDMGVQVKPPRGESAPVVVDAVEKDADSRAAAASASGGSFGGPFVYASAAGEVATPGEGASQALVGALRRKAADYDQSDEIQARNNGGGGNFQNNGGAVSNGSGFNSGSGSGSGQQANGQDARTFGMAPEAFKQVTQQLEVVGKVNFTYGGLPGGAFSRTAAVATAQPVVAAAQPVAAQGASGPQAVSAERVAARAGSVCGSVLETAINTDFNIPPFVKLLDCGELTGTRLRGKFSKTPDDFFILFNDPFVDPAKHLKIVGSLQAVSANIDRDGTPGVDAAVNNHWPSRLASSAILALANTEKQFIAARGTTSTITPVGTILTVDGLTDQQKQEARVAAVAEGAMNVVTKDVSAGVNREATMTLPKNTILGIQFLSDVKVVTLE